MTNGEAVIWLINIAADIGKAEHRDLWHYEQALCEIREMLESAQPDGYVKIPETGIDDLSSVCQAWIPEEQHYYARYCLHCGADMRGEEND